MCARQVLYLWAIFPGPPNSLFKAGKELQTWPFWVWARMQQGPQHVNLQPWCFHFCGRHSSILFMGDQVARENTAAWPPTHTATDVLWHGIYQPEHLPISICFLAIWLFFSVNCYSYVWFIVLGIICLFHCGHILLGLHCVEMRGWRNTAGRALVLPAANPC